MNILHLASFRGNIGDNAAHQGVYNVLHQTGRGYSITQAEVRPFFGRYLEFTPQIIRQINEHDLLLIGNGGFWRIIDRDSPSGMMLGFTGEVFEQIKPPVVFYGLGAEIPPKPDARCIRRFREFLHHAERHSALSIRNDNSKHLLQDVVRWERVPQQVPDGALLIPRYDKAGGKKNQIAINISFDWLPNDVTFLVKVLAHTCDRLLVEYPDLTLKFVPHRYIDLHYIGMVADSMRQRDSTRIEFMGLNATHDGMLRALVVYMESVMTISMRWHSVMMPFSQGVPSVALCTRGKSVRFFDEIGLPDRCFSARHGGKELEGFAYKVIEVYHNPVIPNWQAMKQQYQNTAREFLTGALKGGA